MRYQAFSLTAVLAVLSSLSACRAPLVYPVDESAPRRIERDDQRLRRHIEFFNSRSAASRAVGSSAAGAVAAYVADELAAGRLMAPLTGEHRVTYFAPRNEPLALSMLWADGDSTGLVPGLDYLLDPRSDSGRFTVSSMVIGGPADSERSMVLRRSDEVIEPEATEGVTAVVGPLEFQRVRRPLTGRVVVRITETGLNRLIPGTEIERSGENLIPLPRNLTIRALAQYVPQASAINVFGFVPGADPVRRDSLLIIATSIDNAGVSQGVPFLDSVHDGSSAASLLELARIVSAERERRPTPPVTMLFAFFSGSHNDQSGLRAYLASPFWPLEATKAIVWLGGGSDAGIIRDILHETEVAAQFVDASSTERLSHIYPAPVTDRFSPLLAIKADDVDQMTIKAAELTDQAMLAIARLVRVRAQSVTPR